MLTDKLPVHEWSIILLFCSILIALTGIAFGRQSTRGETTTPQVVAEQPILTHLEVSIEGAILHPGTYEMPLNSTLQDLVNISGGFLPEADLSRLKFKGKLKNRQKVKIPEKKWMTIYLEGATQNPGPFQVMSGTRCRELATLLTLPPEADLASLKKRRHYLREGEVVHIPFKELKDKKNATKKKNPQKSHENTLSSALLSQKMDVKPLFI